MPDLDITPNAWWWNPDVSPQDLGKMLENNSGRIVSLSPFLRTGELRLAAVWVDNSGINKLNWWWNPDCTAAELGTFLENNHGRLISLVPFVHNAELRVCAAWVENTGPNYQAWWWNPRVDAVSLGKMLKDNDSRLISLTSYLEGSVRQYAGVWVANSAPHKKTWWWNPNVSADELGTMLKNNKGRLVSLDPWIENGALRMAAVWVENLAIENKSWWWNLGLDASALGQKFDLFCSYPVDLKSYGSDSGRALSCAYYGVTHSAVATGSAIKVVGNATLDAVVSDDVAPMDEKTTLDLTVQNLTGGTANVIEATLDVMSTGGYIDELGSLYSGILSGHSPSLSAKQSYKGSAKISLGVGAAQYLVRLKESQNGTQSYSHAIVPMSRAGFKAPALTGAADPIYIGLWTNPAEIVPVWRKGKKANWLTVGGQIVNGPGTSLTIAAWRVHLEIDGSILLDQDLPMTFKSMDAKGQLQSIPLVKGVVALESVRNFFVNGFELNVIPTVFKSAQLTLVANYKTGGRCGAAVIKVPVVLLSPVSVSPPFTGSWSYGNSADHLGFDPHAWPQQRFSIDLTQPINGSTFSGTCTRNLDGTHSGACIENQSFHAYGKAIHAIAEGKVLRAVDQNPENFGFNPNPKTAINYIMIQRGNGDVHSYYHIRTGSLKVKEQAHVNVGDHIADVGNAGGSSEPHLHLGYTRLDDTGRGTLAPMHFEGLKDANTDVMGVPGTGIYTV